MSDNIQNSISIQNGPFKGVEAPQHELQLMDRRGGMVPVWGVHARTRWFLDQFPPAEGWRVDIKVADTGIKMYDNYTPDANGQASIQPTREFTASLVNKDGTVVASGSVLRMINSEGAWKGGVSSARSALYEALGLPDSIIGNGDDDDNSRKQTTSIREVTLPTESPASNAETAQAEPATAVEGIEKVADLGSEPLERDDGKSGTPVAAEASQANTAESDQQNGGKSEQTFQLDGKPEEKAEPKPRAAKKDPKQAAIEKAATSKDVPKSLVRQIEIIAKQQGKSVPDFNTIDEATDFLAKLRLPNASKPQQQQGGVQ